MTELADHTAFVTGASRGIGRACALAFADAGCDVALVARSRDDLETVADECADFGVDTAVLPTDVGDRDDVERAVSHCVDALGGLDILVNNAGRGHADEAVDRADLDEWESTVDVNLKGTLFATRFAGPHLRDTSDAGRRAAVINVVSVAGKISFEGDGAYCASKHGVTGLSGSTFEDLREDGIKVSALYPGFVNTDLVSGDNLDRDKMIQPEDVAETALFVAKFPETGCPTEIYLRPQRTPYLEGNEE